MRCREGKHLVCPKLGVRWGGWQELGAPWDLIPKTSHSYWPSLPKGLAWDCPKPNGEQMAGEVLDELLLLCSLFFFCSLQKETFQGNQLFLIKLSWRKVSWHHKVLCGQKMCVCSHKGPWQRCGNPRPVSDLHGQISPSLMSFWSWSHWHGAAGPGCSQTHGSFSQNT